MEPLPSINKVFSLVMQQERKGNGSRNLANENKVLMSTTDKGYRIQEQASWRGQGRSNRSRTQGRGRGRNPNQGKQCTYCHKMNHTAEECYSKHGYPPWYKQKIEQDKRSYSNKNSNAQQMCNLNVNPESQKSSDHTPEEGAASTTLSIEQIQRLLKLLDDKDEPKHTVSHIQSFSNSALTHKNQQGKTWILDTGATNHVTHDLSQFSSFYKIKPITIILPNNSTVIAEFVGTKNFSYSLIIFNVLYIPEFSFNIIFVQTLIKDSNCKLIFSYEQCQI